jgi:KDO2-lipid IV(A) lauroyltransferase
MKVDKKEPYNNKVSFEASMLSPRYFPTWMGIGLLYLISQCPIQFQLFLGKFLGLILHSVSSQRKKIVEINLKLCFPNKTEEERREMVKEVFKDMGKGLLETGIAWWGSDQFIEKLITKKLNFELLDDVNEGCLILLKHSTHAELDIRIICNLIKSGGMYKSQTNKVMNYLMINARNKYAIGTVTNRQTRRGLGFLRNGLKFLYAADQDYGSRGSEFIPFFGIQAATVTLPSDLFKKGIKVYFYNVVRVGSGYEITLEDLGSRTNEENFLTLMNETYEKAILETPTQYFWMHRRFKNRPEGEEGFYPYWKKREKRREKQRKKRA